MQEPANDQAPLKEGIGRDGIQKDLAKVSTKLRVRNTFIDMPERSPSLERFYEERLVRSTPPTVPGTANPSAGNSRPPSGPPSSAGSATIPGSGAQKGAAGVLHQKVDENYGYTCLGIAGGNDGSARVDAASCSNTTAAGDERGRASGAISTTTYSDAGHAAADQADDCLDPEGPVLGSPGFPSRGSALHKWGVCKPCAFVDQALCKNGVDCQFCHLCKPGERKRRKKERLAMKREALAESRAVRETGSCLPGYAPVL